MFTNNVTGDVTVSGATSSLGADSVTAQEIAFVSSQTATAGRLLIADGSDNFETRFLVNDYCLKNKKILVSGAISKFDGHIYTFNFLKKNSPCLRCLMPKIHKNINLNCEFDGVLGPLAGIVGCIQASEIIKEILHIGDSLCGHILIIDCLKLTFRKVKLKKNAKCLCNKRS